MIATQVYHNNHHDCNHTQQSAVCFRNGESFTPFRFTVGNTETRKKKISSGYNAPNPLLGEKRFGNYGWVLRDVKKVYPTPHAKSNTTSKHYHSRVNSGTVATTFQHTRAYSIPRDTNHQNSPTRSGKVKSQHHSNTQPRELPRYRSRTARVIAGDSGMYPHQFTHPTKAKYTQKKHHLHRVVKQHSRNIAFHHHANMMYRYGYPTTIPPPGCLHKLTTHSYSPRTQQNHQFSPNNTRL